MRYQAIAPVIATGLLCLGCGQAAEDKGEWSQWRGTEAMGVATATNLPVTWASDSPNVRWRAEIPGHGNSSPIVDGGRVYLTTATWEEEDAGEADKRQMWRTALALDVETGAILWQTPIFTGRKGQVHPMNTYAAPTPASDGESIFVYFGQYLARLDTEGNIVWKQEVEPDYPQFTRYGVASSPILTDDTVIVTQDREWGDTEDDGWLAAYAKDTGEVVWRNEWMNTCCAYSTPILWHDGSALQLIYAHSGKISGYDPNTGGELWSQKYKIAQTVTTPVMDGDLLCVAGGGNRVQSSLCMRMTGTGESTQGEVLWTQRRNVPNSASPVLYDGKLYTVTDRAVMSSYDALSGDQLWKHRVARGNYRASLVAGDGKVYVTSSAGVTTVVAAEPEFRALAENTLDEGSNASAAFGGGCLLLRTEGHLYCIEKEAKPDDA